jgi:hypothetical protein
VQGEKLLAQAKKQILSLYSDHFGWRPFTLPSLLWKDLYCLSASSWSVWVFMRTWGHFRSSVWSRYQSAFEECYCVTFRAWKSHCQWIGSVPVWRISRFKIQNWVVARQF